MKTEIGNRKHIGYKIATHNTVDISYPEIKLRKDTLTGGKFEALNKIKDSIDDCMKKLSIARNDCVRELARIEKGKNKEEELF